MFIQGIDDVFERLIYWSVDWLIDRLIVFLFGWLIDGVFIPFFSQLTCHVWKKPLLLGNRARIQARTSNVQSANGVVCVERRNQSKPNRYVACLPLSVAVVLAWNNLELIVFTFDFRKAYAAPSASGFSICAVIFPMWWSRKKTTVSWSAVFDCLIDWLID